jgi:phage terminase large subunit
VEEGVEFLKGYDIVVHPRCKHVVDELSTYSYQIDKKTEEVLPLLADKKNHTIDSLRYAVEAVRRSTYASDLSWVGGPSVEAVKKQQDVRGSWKGRVP